VVPLLKEISMKDHFLIITSRQELEELFDSFINPAIEKSTTVITSPSGQSEFITRKEAAALLSVSLTTAMSWSKKGLLPFYRINSRVRYKREDVLNALKRASAGPERRCKD
jgi:excisionase family DNA binding protein